MHYFLKFFVTCVCLLGLSGCSEYKNSPIQEITELKQTVRLQPVYKNLEKSFPKNRKLALLLETESHITIHEHNKDTISLKNIHHTNLSNNILAGESNDTTYIIQEGTITDSKKNSLISFDLYIPKTIDLKINANSLVLNGKVSTKNLKINAGRASLAASKIQTQESIRISAGSTDITSDLIAEKKIHISSGKSDVNNLIIKAKNLSISSGGVVISCKNAQCQTARISGGSINAHINFTKANTLTISGGSVTGKIIVPETTNVTGGKKGAQIIHTV